VKEKLTARDMLRNEIRDRLEAVAEGARKAKRMAVTNENLTDLVDGIDEDLQAVIALINGARRGDGVSRNFDVAFRLTVEPNTDEHLHTPKSVASEIQSWLEGLHATVHGISVAPSRSKAVNS